MQDNAAQPAKDAGIPTRVPVIPVAAAVVFPHVVLPLAFGEGGIGAPLREALEKQSSLLLLTVLPGRRFEETDPSNPPFYRVGTLGTVAHVVELPDASTRLLVEGTARVRVLEFSHDADGWHATVEPVAEETGSAEQMEALHREIVRTYDEVLTLQPRATPELKKLLHELEDPAHLADIVAANMNLDIEQKQALLEEARVPRRLERLLRHLAEERRVLEFGTDLQKKIRAEVDKTQREYWLREQMKLIREELDEDEDSDVARLRDAVARAGMPDPAREHAEREMRRLERTPMQMPEYQLIRNYLDWIVSLPWSRESEESINIDRARDILNRDHYDLAEIKQRIIEHLAVRKLNPGQHGAILCFAGPPGVGKTSLGRSIAESLGRKFVRISLGGVHDEAEIRGHRRTYVGAMPGRIIHALRQADVRNPLVLLDEVDKLAQDFRGDPAAALLEVLDPAQNNTFTDHFLEVPFDLSRVMFIGTVNQLSTVPPALLDRLEVLELPGYTRSEKFEIARRYLIPRQLREAGLTSGHVAISDDALRALIADYTREAGVRELERQVARLMRKTALQVVETGGVASGLSIDPTNLSEYAGKPRFDAELAGRENEIGTAVALAYTPAGGQILFIEAVSMAGTGQISSTGQLGDVMRESAQAALSYVRAHARALHIAQDRFDKKDVHIHVPAGATPKDGPSAGAALVVALASLFTGRAVKCDVAMTGEITLRGHVLPVGGVKEKLIAASHSGIRTVLLPRRNERDLADLPEDVRGRLNCILVDRADELLAHALIERRVRGERKSIVLTPESNVA